MDMTGDLGTKMATALAAFPAEMRDALAPLVQTIIEGITAAENRAADRLDALEAKTAADASVLETQTMADMGTMEGNLLRRADRLIGLIEGGFTITATIAPTPKVAG